MPPMLNYLRYCMLLVPMAAVFYLVPIERPGIALVFMLLLVWFVQLRNKWLPAAWQAPSAVLEAGAVAWLAMQYGGPLYIVLGSTLLSLYIRPTAYRPALFAVLLLALNLVLLREPAQTILTANLFFAAFAWILERSRQTETKNRELVVVYDHLRKQHYELEAARERIMQHARQIEQLTQLNERNRIASDLHDELGHKLIRLKMMLEAAVRIAPSDPHKAQSLTIQVKDQLADSMEAMRRTVRRIQPRQEYRQFALDRLIAEFASESGIAVHFDIGGSPYPLYPSEELILYRNAQESMTNAIRHGQATEVRIALQFEPHHIRFSVSNNGVTPASGQLEQKGLGLTGMHERIRLFGGELLVQAEPPFTITTILPHRRSDAVQGGNPHD